MNTRLHEHKATLYATYLTLAGQYHPDLVNEPKDAAEARFRKIEDAYEVLRDALCDAASDPASPGKRDRLSLRQDQAALARRHRKRGLEPLIFAVILLVLASFLSCCIMDIRQRMAMPSPWLSNLFASFNSAPQMLAANVGADFAQRPGRGDVASDAASLPSRPTEHPNHESDAISPAPPSPSGDLNAFGGPRLSGRAYRHDLSSRSWLPHDRPQARQNGCWRDRSIRGPCFPN
jgi:curved DNA-binding protein CbpA